MTFLGFNHDNSIEQNLRNYVDAAAGMGGGTPGKKTTPAMQAITFAGDVFLALSNRETREFLTEGSRTISPYVRNVVALDNFIRGNGWKKINIGRTADASWREKADFWGSLGSGLVLLNSGASLFSLGNYPCISFYGTKSLSLNEILQRGIEVSRVGVHGSVLYAEHQDVSEKFSRNSYYETATKIASVASSVSAFGSLAASWCGLSQVSSVLGATSGVFGAVRFLASWNDMKSGNELSRLKQEMMTAFDVFGEEILQKIRDGMLDNRPGVEKREELFALKNTIKSLQSDEIGMTASLVAFSSLKEELNRLGYITKKTSNKADFLIKRITDNLTKSPLLKSRPANP